MSKKPDEIKKISINNQVITLYQFNSISPTHGIKAKLTGSVSQVIECNVQPSNLYTISPNMIPAGSFGIGAGAKSSNDVLSALGEAFGMNRRFFLAHP